MPVDAFSNTGLQKILGLCAKRGHELIKEALLLLAFGLDLLLHILQNRHDLAADSPLQ